MKALPMFLLCLIATLTIHGQKKAVKKNTGNNFCRVLQKIFNNTPTKFISIRIGEQMNFEDKRGATFGYGWRSKIAIPGTIRSYISEYDDTLYIGHYESPTSEETAKAKTKQITAQLLACLPGYVANETSEMIYHNNLIQTRVDFLPPASSEEKINIWLEVYPKSIYDYTIDLMIKKAIAKKDTYVNTYTETKAVTNNNSLLSTQLKKVIDQSTKKFEEIIGKAVYSEAITVMDIISYYTTDYILDGATSARIENNFMDNGQLNYKAIYGTRSTEDDAVAVYNQLTEKFRSALGDDYKYREKTTYGNEIKVMAFVNKNKEQEEVIQLVVEKDKHSGEYEIFVTIESSMKARFLSE